MTSLKTKQIQLITQLVLLPLHMVIQNVQIDFTWHDSNYFQKGNNFINPKLIIELSHFIPHQCNTKFYLITQMSIQLQMTLSLISLLSLMTLTALSKYMPKQITLFLQNLFKLNSFCFHFSYRTLACQIQLSFLTWKTLQNWAPFSASNNFSCRK